MAKADNPSKRGNEDPGMAALGELICRLNPYTGQPWSNTTGFKTGKMEVATLPPTGLQAAQEAAATAPERALTDAEKRLLGTAREKHEVGLTGPEKAVLAKVKSLTNDAHLDSIAQIGIEVARNYGAQWTFKGQTLTVKSAVRIPYRFPVQDEHGTTLYWQTEFLLIGYAGSDGA